MLLKGKPTWIVQDMGGFVARINMPGWLLRRPTDHGYGPLAMVVESQLDPGRLIVMHEHRDDEIVSWVPEGVMRHNDRVRGALTIDGDHLMVMNAGRSFWHSEETLATDPPLRMLQILIRPRSSGLNPAMQFGALPDVPPTQWRHLVGPEGGPAPFHVRSEVDIYDIRLPAGLRADFPRAPRRHLYFYQFVGRSAAGGKEFRESEQGLLPSDEPLSVVAETDSILVAFLIDLKSQVACIGTVGDHPKIPRPLFVPFLKLAHQMRQSFRASSTRA